MDPLRLVSDRPVPDEEWENAVEDGEVVEGGQGDQELELEVSEEGRLVVDEEREELEDGEIEEDPPVDEEKGEDLRKLLDEKKSLKGTSNQSESGPPSVIYVPPRTEEQKAMQELQHSLMKLAGLPVTVRAQEVGPKSAETAGTAPLPGPSTSTPFDARFKRKQEGAAEIYREEARQMGKQFGKFATVTKDETMKLVGELAVKAEEGKRKASQLPYLSQQKDAPAINKNRLDHDVLGPEELEKNVFAEIPRFHRRCSFCGAGHCSRYMRGSEEDTNCRKFREQQAYAKKRRVCEYRRCPAAWDHVTSVCPTLHRRCLDCGCRGHATGDGCDLQNAAIMSRLRADFEECASSGLYTRRRFENVGWGFYPYPETAPADGKIVAYRRLSEEPVLEALLLMDSLVKDPSNGGMET